MKYHIVTDATVPKGSLVFKPFQRTIAEMVEGQPKETDIFVNPEDFPRMAEPGGGGFECDNYSLVLDQLNNLHVWQMRRGGD